MPRGYDAPSGPSASRLGLCSLACHGGARGGEGSASLLSNLRSRERKRRANSSSSSRILGNLGWVDGKTVKIDYLSAEGDGGRFSALASECVKQKADVIVVTTTPAAKAAKAATSSTPIVMDSLGDPVATGLVAELAQPGWEHYRNDAHIHGHCCQTSVTPERGRTRTVECARAHLRCRSDRSASSQGTTKCG